MTLAEKKRTMGDIEAAVLRWLGHDWDTDRLFWLRVDLGQEYIRECIPTYLHKPVQDSAAFWAWLLQVWHINDRRWLNSNEGLPYTVWHRRELKRYHIKLNNLGLNLKSTDKPAT